ncbi:MAG: PAS domain S-box protein, partial [Aquaticitalea sp.]
MHLPNLTKKEPPSETEENDIPIPAKLPEASHLEFERNEAYINHLASIVESSEDAIVSKTLNGTITSWNQGCEKMFGYPAKEAVGENISIIIPAEFISEEKNILERIRNNKSIDHFETIRVKKNGERINVSLTVSPLRNSDGIIIGISKIARDISSRKKAEAASLLISKQLEFQIEETEKRAAELVSANTELAFQIEEKGKKELELNLANQELLLRNAQNEKRALELLVANKELAFQIEEKEKRAAELIIANRNLEI